MLENIKAFVLDMDGTIYLGNELFPFTKDFLSRVEETGRKFYFFTNNSSKSQQAYIEKLSNMGIAISKEQMMISSHVMIRFLLEKHPGKSVYVVGTSSLLNEFRSFGIPLVEEDPDIVVLGFDRACHSIRNGCIYYGINPDLNCPMEGGTFIPDCGSMARLVEASTGRYPEFFGKPSKHTLNYMIQETGYRPDEIAIVGDRLYTDIAVADQSEVTSILVLSGESTLKDVENGDIKPDLIVKDLSEITREL